MKALIVVAILAVFGYGWLEYTGKITSWSSFYNWVKGLFSKGPNNPVEPPK